MDKKIAMALEKSIRKWKKNVTAESARDVLIGVDDCPLCELFYLSDCENCPVKTRTKTHHCHKTPYVEVVRIVNAAPYDKPTEALRQAMFDELDFLISLREK